MLYAVIGLWAALLAGAWFHVRRIRHPDAPFLEAYLIFLTVFTVGSFLLFAALTFAFTALGAGEALANPILAVIVLAVVFVPPFLVAGKFASGPPRQRRPR